MSTSRSIYPSFSLDVAKMPNYLYFGYFDIIKSCMLLGFGRADATGIELVHSHHVYQNLSSPYSNGIN